MHRRVEFISLAAEGLGELVRADAHTAHTIGAQSSCLISAGLSLS